MKTMKETLCILISEIPMTTSYCAINAPCLIQPINIVIVQQIIMNVSLKKTTFCTAKILLNVQ